VNQDQNKPENKQVVKPSSFVPLITTPTKPTTQTMKSSLSQSSMMRSSFHTLNEDVSKFSSFDLLKDRNGELQKNEEILKHDHSVLKKQFIPSSNIPRLEGLKLKEDERRKENILLNNKIEDLKETLKNKEAEISKLKSKSFHISTLDLVENSSKEDQLKIQNQILQIKVQEQFGVISDIVDVM
jgi:predicted RNase H-like nuclease (RuvC/YqgF family)